MEEDSDQYASCDVCGRTILKGERVRAYATPQGDAVRVCALCKTRAETAGWVPAELAAAGMRNVAVRRRPAIALRERLGRVAERARGPAGPPRERGARTERPPSAPPRRAAEHPPPAPRPEPRTPEEVAQRAVERFNVSHEQRKVAGLIRSLGQPSVGVHPRGRTARVTVAWEISWYQWEIDAAGVVREVARGDELSELDAEAQTWNAAAASDGTLQVGS